MPFPLQRFGGAAAISLLCLAQAGASTLPRIGGVAFTQTAPGLYSATLTGLHFGTAPAGIPCTSCTPGQVSVVNAAYQPHQQVIDVAAWSDTAITLNNIQAGTGDSLRIGVYNATTGFTAAWGGTTAHNANLPTISAVSTTGTGAARVFTITGHGFGPAPGLGANIDTPYLVITDWNVTEPYTQAFPWNGGFCGRPDCNGVTANYTSWSDTQIVISGFGSSYGSNGWIVSPGDSVCVGVWPTTLPGSDGTWGGRFYCTRI